MVLRCAGTFKNRLESGSVTAGLTTTVAHSKMLIDDVNPVHSFSHIEEINKITRISMTDNEEFETLVSALILL